MVKNPPANTGDLGSIPGQENPLEEGMAIHSSILAWRIPYTYDAIAKLTFPKLSFPIRKMELLTPIRECGFKNKLNIFTDNA